MIDKVGENLYRSSLRPFKQKLYRLGYAAHGVGAADRVVAGVLVPVDEHRGGLFTMTPDGQMIIGPHPDIRGFWIATGCNGSGFSLSPGVGQVLAEWVVQGAPSIDLTTCAPDRFRSRAFDDEQLRSAGVWQYAHYYEPAATTVLEPGMIFTIEPMITMGSIQPVIWPDRWTAVTSDGSRSAQFEHTVLVTSTGVEVLTR